MQTPGKENLKFRNLGKQDADQITEDWLSLVGLLNSWGFRAYLGFGSLLGAVREGDYIQGDDDVDIFYVSNQTDRWFVVEELRDLLNRLKQSALLHKVWIDTGVSWGELWNDSMYPVGQQHVWSPNKRNVFDLFTSWVEKDELIFCQWGRCGKVNLKETRIPFRDVEINVPMGNEKILRYLFGDWRTPRSEKIKLERSTWLYRNPFE